MRNPIGIIGLALLAAACIRDPLFPGTPRSSHEPGGGRRPDSTATDTPLPGEHVYLTAVRFPDGYAWDLDTCAVDGEVRIDLYRDGERVRSLPAGASVHPDMHRYMGGHLYLDWSTDTETIVSRDGAELFRFEGRESLRGFLVREDGVHTLGQDRDGNGFTYRIDGRILYRSETGAVLGGPEASGTPGGAFSEAGEDVYYVCCLPSERGREFHVMRNAERYRSFPASEGTQDVLVAGGTVSRVRSKPRSLVLEVDGKETPLPLGGGSRPGKTTSWPWSAPRVPAENGISCRPPAGRCSPRCRAKRSRTCWPTAGGWDGPSPTGGATCCACAGTTAG